jgi:hypothetical protein
MTFRSVRAGTFITEDAYFLKHVSQWTRTPVLVNNCAIPSTSGFVEAHLICAHVVDLGDGAEDTGYRS